MGINMADNLRKQRQNNIHINTHKFSWFPSVLLIFQLFLLLFELFKFDLEIVNAFNQFLQQSSFFLSIINALLILWYWIKGAILKQTNTREFKIVNSCICFANIVLLNKAYDNKKITEIFNSVKDFFSGKNIAICVFVLIIIVAIILIVRYARKDDNYDTPNETPVNNSANSSTATNNTQPQKPSTPNKSKPKDASANALFFIILMILLILIAAVVYILIAKYDIITNIINDADKGYNILAYLLLVISAIALIFLSIIIVTAIARSISKLIFQIPEYIRNSEALDDKIIKIAVGIVLIPIFYGITKLFGISTDWILNLLQKQDFLVVPFTILLYFVLSMVFVEVLYGLFSGRPRAKWLNDFTKIISDTGDNVVNICSSIVNSFFRLIKFIPDFLESIETVLIGEVDENNNLQTNQNDQNDQGDNNNQSKE